MCRWLAYTGPSIPLDSLLINPNNSLVDQSLDAKMLDMPVKTRAAFSPKRRVGVSGEGFGFAWLGRNGKLGQFREPTPAWDSDNVVSLARHLESTCFLAHARAAPGRTVSAANCHPFVHGTVMFQHNGFIADFPSMRKELLDLIDPALFPSVEGNTDSEVCFYLALTFGLEDDPVGAFRKMRRTIESLREKHESSLPFVATIAASNGESVSVLRTSSTGSEQTGNGFSSPSLYYTSGPQTFTGHEGMEISLPAGGQLIASEPLELAYNPEVWEEFPDHTIGVFTPGKKPVFAPAF